MSDATANRLLALLVTVVLAAIVGVLGMVLVRLRARRKRIDQLAARSPAEAAQERSKFGHMNKWAASVFLWLIGVFVLIGFGEEGGFERARRSGSGLYALFAFGIALIIGGFVSFGAFGWFAERAREKADGTLTNAEGVGGDTKTCPECAETIKSAARKCRYCGHAFGEPLA